MKAEELAQLARKIDYALVGPELSREDVEQGCELAKRLKCYAVVVKPHYIECAHKLIKDSPVKLVSVVGFPHGSVTTAVKMFEARDVLQRGADEIDLVMNLGALRDKENLAVQNDISIVVKTARAHPVKVILETGLLSEEEIARGCKIAEEAGAAYVVTSSGFGPPRSIVEDVALMGASVTSNVQIKAGGVSSWRDAMQAVEAGASRLGTTDPLRILDGES